MVYNMDNIEQKLEIEDDKLKQLFSKIKPVVRKDGCNGLYYIKDVDLRNVAFTWSPEITEDATGLKPFKTIITFHKYGYQGMFKPSIAEVLAQIPKRYTNKCVAFEIDKNVKIDTKNSCHISNTTLYMRT